MNAVKNFLSFVEISTKIASVFPFLVGTGYALYHYGTLQLLPTLVFFIAMLLFDMTTTALNNHVGQRQSGKKPHYSTPVSLFFIFSMGLGATVLGIYLVTLSNLSVLLVGMLCFATGVIYNYGFIPISHTPFGELLSGGVMGICIPFIAVEINHPMSHIAFAGFEVTASLQWLEALSLGIVAMPLILCIANIMLANNICDVEEDTQVGRYTLPFYIGKGHALQLYRLLYYGAYGFILLSAVLGLAPLWCLLSLLLLPQVHKNIGRFFQLQDKRSTFAIAIVNFLLILVPYAALIWLGALLRLL